MRAVGRTQFGGIPAATLQTRMLRAMWRELETELRNDLYGHEWGAPDADKVGRGELSRQLSTLPACLVHKRPRNSERYISKS